MLPNDHSPTLSSFSGKRKPSFGISKEKVKSAWMETPLVGWSANMPEGMSTATFVAVVGSDAQSNPPKTLPPDG